MRIVSAAEMREIEPCAAGRAAIHVPEEGIVDYPGVAALLGRLITAQGGRIVLQALVTGITLDGVAWRVESDAGHFPPTTT
jgi:L-2-hydroxyglutarate oxidase